MYSAYDNNEELFEFAVDAQYVFKIPIKVRVVQVEGVNQSTPTKPKK